MEIINNTYLKFIESKNFFSWDVKSFFLSQGIFKENIPFVLFGEFLSKYETTKIHIEDNKTYKILGVRTYGNGVFVNREVKGNTLNMKTYQLADENTLFWCKVDTKNGGFGIVKKEHEGGLGSSNMFFAKIDINKINSEYLQLLFKSPQIHSYMDQFVTGTTNRKYIKPDQLLSEIKIPLPSLLEQNKIVEEYNKKLQDSMNAEIKAGNLEKEIESYLIEELGIEVKEKEEKKVGLRFVDYEKIKEWGIDKINIFNLFTSNKNKIVSLLDNTEYYLDIKRGKSPEYSEKGNKIILNQKCNRWDEIDLQFGKTVDENWLKGVDNNLLTQTGDILINSTGEGTIGRASLIREGFEGLLYDSHLLLLRLNQSIINPDFFVMFFNNNLGQEQVNNIKSAQATKQTELGVGNLLKIFFPLPKIEVQEKIVKHISDLKEEIKSLKKLSDDLKESAKVEFEKEIFS